MEVTKFLHRCESSGTSQMTDSSLPTLFGNNNMKMDVACKVFIAISNTALFFFNNANLIYRLEHLMIGAASCIFHGQVTCVCMEPTIYEKIKFLLRQHRRGWSSSTQSSNFQMQRIPNTNSNMPFDCACFVLKQGKYYCYSNPSSRQLSSICNLPDVPQGISV